MVRTARVVRLAAAVLALVACLAPRVAVAQELPREIGEESSGFDNATADMLAPPDEHVAELAGRPVLGVSVETSGRRWQSKPALSSVPLGAPLTPELARAAVREILGSGGFAQAYADARVYQDGVILRVVALPRRIAAEVLLDAAAVPAQRVRATLGIATGGEITEPILRDVRSRVLELYRRHGYDRARVTITSSDTDDPMKVLVKVTATAGPPRRVSRRIFVVGPTFQRFVEGLYDRYGVSAGDVADEDDLVEADGDFAETLRKRNFLQATVKHRALRRGANVFLYVYLQSGPEYRFEFEEARAFDRRELIDALDLAKAAEPSAAALADRIAAYYQKRSYLDVRVTPREEEREAGAVKLITFEIHEGDPARS
jgi:outer membrane protein insertion porin family